MKASTVICLISMALSIGVTVGVLRIRYDRSPLPLRFLTRQARPANKVTNVLLYVSALCVVGAFVAEGLDNPVALRPLLFPLTVATLLLSQLVQRYVQRVRALEGIIKLSLPDLYSEIREEKG